LNEFLDYAKAHPGELTYSTAGPGTVTHVAMEQLLAKTGADVKHVPFQGDAPASTALMGGHVDLYMGMMTVIEQKQLNGIAVFSDERVPSLPDLPTAKEQGVDLIAGWWAGVIAPKGTPATVVAA